MGAKKEEAMKMTQKNKKEVVEYKSFIDLPDRLYLAVRDGDEYFFAYLSDSGEIELTKFVEVDGKKYTPLKVMKSDTEDEMPVGYPSVGITIAEDLTTEELFQRIKKHLQKYVDLAEDDMEMVIFYILSTWFYRKANTVAYLRFIGDTGKGKTRMLEVVGDLCFYPLVVNGGATRSAIMKAHQLYHGTLVLDEADFRGDKEDELVKFLNAGFQRGKPAILSNKNNPDKLEIYSSFGPKVIAMRHPFRDAATEGRLLSISPYETRRKDIPPVLLNEYRDEVTHLRDVIARWTLRNWTNVQWNLSERIFQLPVEPRLKQLAVSLSIILPLFDSEMGNRLEQWMIKRQRMIAEQRANSDEGMIFNTLVDIAEEIISERRVPQSYEMLLEYMDDNTTERRIAAVTTGLLKELTGFSARKINHILQEMGFEVRRETREINGEKVRARFVCVKDTDRWIENWQRYRYGEEAIEIPQMYRCRGRKYSPVNEDIRVLNDEAREMGSTVRCLVLEDIKIKSQKLDKVVTVHAGTEILRSSEEAEILQKAGKVKITGW